MNSPGSFSCNCPHLHYLSIDAATCVYYGPSIEQEVTTPTSPTTTITTATTFHAAAATTATTSVATAGTQFQATPTNPHTNSPATVVPTEYHCGGVLTSDVGSLHSENWPETYPVNVVCEWNITLPNPKLVLEILFDDNPFGLAGKMPQCKRDWVKVYGMDENRTVTSMWGPFCSFETPPPISTKTSSAMVQFHSGSKHGSSRRGFKVYYQVLELCVLPPPPLSVKGTIINTQLHMCIGKRR